MNSRPGMIKMTEDLGASLSALSENTTIVYFKPTPNNAVLYMYPNMQMRFLTPANLPKNGKKGVLG